jgi:hypothetical protein
MIQEEKQKKLIRSMLIYDINDMYLIDTTNLQP